MAIPEYCDDRAKKYFTHCFVGSKHGENGTSHCWSWQSTAGAIPTSVNFITEHQVYCAYCSGRAYPIQNNIISHNDYDITGYCCVCKDAMDEVAWRAEYDDLLRRQACEREALRKKAPNPSKEATDKILELRVKQLKDDINKGFFSTRALDKLGIHLGHPYEHFKQED